jgi:hypothetical protein
MSDQAGDVIGGFNTYIGEMRAEARNDGLSTVVSLVTFADDHRIVFAGKAVADVTPLTREDYRAVGSTALLDTVYASVTQYREHIGQGVFGGTHAQEDSPSVLVIIFTDGHENASTRATAAQVREVIDACERLGNWTFSYVGAHAGVWAQAEGIAMKKGNTLDATGLDFHETTDRLVASSKKHRTNYRDLDLKATEDVFEEA